MSEDIQTAINVEAQSKNAVKPLSEFLKKQIDQTSDKTARESFEAHLAGLNGCWAIRLKASQRAKGIEQIRRIREIFRIPEIRTVDNRQQYASKLKSLGGVA